MYIVADSMIGKLCYRFMCYPVWSNSSFLTASINLMAKINLTTVPYSILDLATIAHDRTTADAFHHSLEVAQLGERLGYKRYWLAEHHNSISVGSAATSVLI